MSRNVDKIPTRWSYSSYNMWASCNFKYFLGKIKRLPDPSGPAAERGTAIHLKAEYLVKGEITGMPNELKKFKKEFSALRRLKAKTEEEWAFDVKWKSVPWNHPGAWVRGKVDAHHLDDVVLTSIDYKTGKIYPNHREQGDIYNLMGFAKFKKLEEAHIEFWYLDQGSLGASPFIMERKQLKEIKEKWTERGMKMMNDRVFKPMPSVDACRWCNFKTSKGGTCDEWKKVLK